MTHFTLRYPPIIHFGWHASNDLGDVLAEIAGDGQQIRPYFICSSTVVKNGWLERLSQCLPDTGFELSKGVPHDPDLDTVDTLVRKIRHVRPNLVVAIGGGSVIDAAKAAAAIAPFGDSVIPFFRGEKMQPSRGLPFVALPSTAGTGADITANSVLTDTEASIKKSLRSPHMIPDATIIDPALTVSCTPELTVASGLDALTQAVESYLSRKANTATRALAANALQLLYGALEKAWQNGNDKTARCRVAEGSMLGAMAFSQSSLGAVHGLAHPIGAALNLSHGLTCAVLLPHVLELNLPAAKKEMADLGQLVGAESARSFVNRIKALCQRLNVPPDFSDSGLKPEHFAHIVANCRSGSMRSNPRKVSDREVASLLTRLCGKHSSQDS